MEQIKWYQSTTLRALLVAFVSQVIVWTGVAEQLPDGAATLAVDALLQVIAIAATAYAAWARANRANPPITEAAVRKVEERQSGAVDIGNQSQGGFVRPVVLAVLLALTLPVALTLPGCTHFGLEQAQTLDQRLAFAYGAHMAVLDAAAVGVQTGKLTAEDGEHVLKLADESRLLLDAGRVAAGGGDISTAEGRLVLALGVLTQLQTYLNTRGVK